MDNVMKSADELILPLVMDGVAKVSDWNFKLHAWQAHMIVELDEMVRSFLTFPDAVEQDYRDRQFARHLLWRIGDERKMFVTLYLRGAEPVDFCWLWLRLMPYITGEYPEKVAATDPRLMKLCQAMYRITHDLVLLHISDFSELMDEVAGLVQELRG